MKEEKEKKLKTPVRGGRTNQNPVQQRHSRSWEYAPSKPLAISILWELPLLGRVLLKIAQVDCLPPATG